MTLMFRRPAFALSAAILLGGSSMAFAQGTTAQREACAPDAIKLCQDAIPDVEKTTACMKAHQAELSPQCRRMFTAATEPSRPGRRSQRRTTAAQPAPDEGIDVGALNVGQLDAGLSDTPDTRSDAEDLRNARRVVGRLCRGEILDAETCRLTQGAINLRAADIGGR